MSGERIVTGYVRRAHGIRGEVIARSLSDDPERFRVGASFVTDEVPVRTLQVASSRPHADGFLIRFEGVVDRNTAELLKGVSLTIGVDERRTLGADEFWPDQLIGLLAVTPGGAELGTVADVVFGEAQDRLVVTTPGDDRVEVPFVEAIVGHVDREDGTVAVDPPEGLFPEA